MIVKFYVFQATLRLELEPFIGIYSRGQGQLIAKHLWLVLNVHEIPMNQIYFNLGHIQGLFRLGANALEDLERMKILKKK